MEINSIRSRIDNIDNYSREELENIAKEYKIEPLLSNGEIIPKEERNKERLRKVLIELSKQYIPYPTKKDTEFFKKIYEKKNFYENKYTLPSFKKNPQEELCPSKNTNFKLLPACIFWWFNFI